MSSDDMSVCQPVIGTSSAVSKVERWRQRAPRMEMSFPAFSAAFLSGIFGRAVRGARRGPRLKLKRSSLRGKRRLRDTWMTWENASTLTVLAESKRAGVLAGCGEMSRTKSERFGQRLLDTLRRPNAAVCLLAGGDSRVALARSRNSALMPSRSPSGNHSHI